MSGKRIEVEVAPTVNYPELVPSIDPHDVPPWRPADLHVGVSIQFTEADGRSFSGNVGGEIKPGETLEKFIRRIQREATARAIEMGFNYEKHNAKDKHGER